MVTSKMMVDEAIGQVLQTARNEIGVREVGTSNTGKRVQSYQAATTLGGTGWPWCAAFVAWCMKYALGNDLAQTVWIPTASCDLILDWATRKGIISTTPIAGCVGLVMASRHDATHTFIVTAVDNDDETFSTIEGNTNNDGSAEGNGVYTRTRRFENRYLFVHWMNLLPNSDMWKIYASDGHLMGEYPAIDGHVHIPARTWGTWFGLTTGWDQDNQQVAYDGSPVKSQIKLMDGTAWLPIRALAGNQGLDIAANSLYKTIMLSKPEDAKKRGK